MELVNPVYCKNFVSKGIGQMFRSKPVTMVFVLNKEQFVPLHMMFVFFPIDVAYLDKDKKIIELVENLKPFGYHNPYCKAKYVVEFANGTISDNNLELGDKITFS